MKRARVALCLACVLTSQGVLPARADVLYLAGASGGTNSDYAFAGAIVPLPGSALGSGFGVRIWGDYLDYTYRTGGREISASGWGGALAGVYQFSGDWGWSNLSAGMSYRDTHLSANDPSNHQRGGHGYLNVQADGGYNLNEAWRVRGLASYTPGTRGYIVQAGIDRRILEHLRLGLGTTFQGDRNYSQVSGAATAYIQIANGFELAPSVGLAHGGGDTGPYGGITVVLAAN